MLISVLAATLSSALARPVNLQDNLILKLKYTLSLNPLPWLG